MKSSSVRDRPKADKPGPKGPKFGRGGGEGVGLAARSEVVTHSELREIFTKGSSGLPRKKRAPGSRAIARDPNFIALCDLLRSGEADPQRFAEYLSAEIKKQKSGQFSG